MKTKYRPEKITLRAPHEIAGEFEPMLKEHLHKRASLEAETTDTHTVFSFWPTKSEYFLISLLFSATCRNLGAKQVTETSK